MSEFSYLYYNGGKYLTVHVEVDFDGMIYDMATHYLEFEANQSDIDKFIVGNIISDVKFSTERDDYFDLVNCLIYSITQTLDKDDIYIVRVNFTSYSENIAMKRKNKLRLL